MAKYKQIPIDIYKRSIFIFIGNHNEFIKWLEWYFVNEKDYKNLIEYAKQTDITNSIANTWYNKTTGECIITIPKFPQSPSEIAYCEHECLHAVFHVLDFCGVEYISGGANEHFTYLLEYFTKSLLTKPDYNNF